ncbi:hypothetical protein B9Z55_021169 [Caenorhabditis nigoni]|uniref:Uncharacterized protein n=1 Tax=Caenorhabditis nigoni TaxID=1611254 RepID=A0A2G5TQU9_9PELO|nr:hypothetical protein B9Z55_021169 [Caenorhabditis nigoni]
MNEAIAKDEVIEESNNFKFKNEEFVEVKREEIEKKPENLLEKEIKTEPIDFFEKNQSETKFFEGTEQKPKECDSKIEKKMCEVLGTIKCEICQRIQSIIDDNDRKLKSPSTRSEQYLRSFIPRSNNLMQV